MTEEIDNEFSKPSHVEYEKEYAIINNETEFKNFIGHKYKIAWLNDRGKKCLRSYILIGVDRTNAENFVSVDLVNGKSQPKNVDSVKHFSKIFTSKNLVFAGYIPPEQILEILKLKEQNFNV